jgi:hypothetical protein
MSEVYFRHARRSDPCSSGAKFAPLAFAPRRKLMGTNASWRKRKLAQTIVRTRPSDGRLLPPRRKAYQSKEFKSPPDENSAASQIESGKQRQER